MAGDNGAVVNYISWILEELFEQAEIAPTWSHKSAPLTLVAPSGSRGEKPEIKKHQPRAKEETEQAHKYKCPRKGQQLNHITYSQCQASRTPPRGEQTSISKKRKHENPKRNTHTQKKT